jgi:hypothetical protein
MNKPTLTRKKSQVAKIVDAAQSVFFASADEANELAFMSRCFIQATLPHSDPGDVPLWGRKSGHYSLTIQPNFIFGPDGKPLNMGLPYGSIPRLLLAFLNGEVVRTGSKTIQMGRSFTDFAQRLGYNSNGGSRGDMTRIRNQAMRLFSSKVSAVYDGPNGKGIKQALLAKEALFFWDPNQPDQQSLWENRITLTEEFFEALKSSPVPLDWRILRALKQSPMALDLYMWLSYRMFTLKKPQTLTWEALAAQLGSEYTELHNFRRKVRQHFLKIKGIWQALQVDLDDPETITLRPSYLLIQPKY